MTITENLLLGREVKYSVEYNPLLLSAIPRTLQRKKLGINNILPFKGVDIWNCYEFSFLNSRGKPVVLILEIYIDADSVNIVESKSLKLYLVSFQNTKFETREKALSTIKKDLSLLLESDIRIEYKEIDNIMVTQAPNAELIDYIDVECNEYIVNPDLLNIYDTEIVTESLYSNLLKSNCLVTGQPDWGTVIITYTGHKIVPDSLLKYIISYRNHSEFHEHCVERIFCDILEKCRPQSLTVYARYTRRGGIDINPFRSNYQSFILNNFRLSRQ